MSNVHVKSDDVTLPYLVFTRELENMADVTVADGGSLYQLERLQEKADRQSSEFEAAQQEKSDLASLRAKVEQLKERRDKLRERLNHGSHKILQDYLKKEKGRSSKRNYSDSQKQNLLAAVQVLHKRKLIDLCDAYRLTGISVALQGAKRTCFRCETFFNARYHEPYYIEVDLEDSELKINKHTVPYFIPIDTISQRYLNTDIKKFFMVISEHLNAYVARREQVQLCQEQYKEKLEDEISCSPAHDYVQFKTKSFDGVDKGVVVKLSYDKLTLTRPSTVEIQSDGRKTAASVRALRSKEKFFKELYLHHAFAEAFT
ncbi:centromere protein O-like [Montipora foliosa]|uniref:centromere protein O-like n=1 Tax=Montipora foliosa TaxID=591990 RepID=UPI0035F1240C